MTKLHIGCGKRDFGSEWVHIDGANFHHIEHHDITNLSQYKDNVVDLIYASHVLEYFDREEVKDVLKEWHRVLKPNGILRLAVPNFRALHYVYESNYDLNYILGPLYGKMQMGDKTIYHKTCYDFESLKSVLLDCGFRNVGGYDWRETEHAKFDDHSQAYMLPKGDKKNGILISLNVECKKI